MTTIKSVASRQNIQDQSTADGLPTSKKTNKTKQIDQISKLASEFESIFLKIVLKSMRDAVPKAELIDGGNGEEIFRSMLDDEYAKQMANQRTSGLADSIERHLRGLNQPVERSNLSVDSMNGMAAYLKLQR